LLERWIVLGCLLLAPPASAQARRLTFAAAVHAAQAAAPQVLVATARTTAARTESGVAGIWPSPQVALGTTSGTARLFASLFVTLPVFGQRSTAIDAADAQARAVAAGQDVARLDAGLAVGEAWLDLWQVTAQGEVAREAADRQARLLAIAVERNRRGAVPRFDVLRARTLAHSSRAEAEALDASRDAAAARLSGLLGADSLTTSWQTEGLPPASDDTPTTAEVERLVDIHPVVQRAGLQVTASQAVIRRDKASRLPLVGIEAGTNQFERYPPPNQDFFVTLRADLPLFRAPLVARADAQTGQAIAEQNALRLEIRTRLWAALADFQAARRRFTSAVHDILPSAVEAAELAAQAYRTGGLDLTAVLAAEQALAQARLTAALATAELGRARIRLDHAAGRSP